MSVIRNYQKLISHVRALLSCGSDFFARDTFKMKYSWGSKRWFISGDISLHIGGPQWLTLCVLLKPQKLLFRTQVGSRLIVYMWLRNMILNQKYYPPISFADRMMVEGELKHTVPTLASPLLTHTNELCLVVHGVVKGDDFRGANYMLILSLYNSEDGGSPHAMLGYVGFEEQTRFNISATIPAGRHRVLVSVKWAYSCSMEVTSIISSDGPCSHDG